MNTQKQLGFNLIEVLVTLSVVGILATIGIPNLNGFLLNNKLTSRTNKLVSTFNFTRGEAIMQNGPVHLTAVDADDWGKGWTIWVDRNGNGEPDADVDPPEILHEVKFSGTTTIKLEDDNFNATALDTISFAQVDSGLRAKTLSYTGGNGTLALTSLIQFNICDNRTGERGRKIEIRPTGRVALTDDEFQCQ